LVVRKSRVDLGMLGQVEAKDGRVSNFAIATWHPSSTLFKPILNHAEFSRLKLKQRIERPCNHNVKIEEQGVTVETDQSGLKQTKLAPRFATTLGIERSFIKGRDR